MCKCMVNSYIFLYISFPDGSEESEKGNSHLQELGVPVFTQMEREGCTLRSQEVVQISKPWTYVRTSWSSRLAMIDKTLKQQNTLAEVLFEATKTHHLVLAHKNQMYWSQSAWDHFFSSPITLTLTMMGEIYVRAVHLKPVLNLFNRTLLTPKEGNTNLTKALKGKILGYSDSKYEMKSFNNYWL